MTRVLRLAAWAALVLGVALSSTTVEAQIADLSGADRDRRRPSQVPRAPLGGYWGWPGVWRGPVFVNSPFFLAPNVPSTHPSFYDRDQFPRGSEDVEPTPPATTRRRPRPTARPLIMEWNPETGRSEVRDFGPYVPPAYESTTPKAQSPFEDTTRPLPTSPPADLPHRQNGDTPPADAATAPSDSA